MNFKKLASYVLILGFLVGTYSVFSNQQDIRDWWYLRSYQPSTEIAALATDAGLSDQGRDYFYVSDPQINDKQNFNDNCPFEEQTIVLGCYDGLNIYILEIDEPQLDGVETVTAAHEMLHAAYERLDDTERAEVDRMVNEQLEQTTNQRIKDLIAEYDQNDKALINNELHSILPTELTDLIPELEEYYSKLFDDRQKVVAAAHKYEEVFVGLEGRMDELQQQIDSYKSQIEGLEAQLAGMASEIEVKREELNRLKENDEIEEYNSKVEPFNSLVRSYNNTIPQLKTVVTLHNELVSQINDAALRHNELVNTIDSNYQSL